MQSTHRDSPVARQPLPPRSRLRFAADSSGAAAVSQSLLSAKNGWHGCIPEPPAPSPQPRAYWTGVGVASLRSISVSRLVSVVYQPKNSTERLWT